MFLLLLLTISVLEGLVTGQMRLACNDSTWDMANTNKYDGSDMCYKSIFWDMARVSFDEARKMCLLQFGADVAPVRNDEEYNAMIASVNRAWVSGTRRGQFYIGARDLSGTSRAEYYWVHDGSPVRYFRWGNAQPSQGSGARYGFNRERCVATLLGYWDMNWPRNFEWNDTFCEGFVDAWFGIRGVVCAKKAELIPDWIVSE